VVGDERLDGPGEQDERDMAVNFFAKPALFAEEPFTQKMKRWFRTKNVAEMVDG
jgi:hypothetical protein